MMKPKKIEKKLKKTAKTAKKTARKTADKVEKTAKSAKKSAEKRAKKVEENVKDRIAPGRSKKKKAGKIVAAAAGVAAAGAVGVAAALRHKKGETVRYHVVPNDEKGWSITAEGSDEPLASFRRKRDAVSAAREMASAGPPTVLAIHSAKGKIQKTHSYGGA